MADRLKPISLSGMTIEEALKKAMDAGSYPEDEAHPEKKKPAKKRTPSKAPKGTSPAARKRSPSKR